MVYEVALNEGENKRGDAGQAANPSTAPLIMGETLSLGIGFMTEQATSAKEVISMVMMDGGGVDVDGKEARSSTR